MNSHKYTLLLGIILGSCILGGFYYAAQINTQKSVEKQQQIEIGQKQIDLQNKIDTDKLNADLETKKIEAQQADNAAALEQKKSELRKSFIPDCEKTEQDYVGYLNTRMNYLDCFDNRDLCKNDDSYNLYISWLNPSNGKTFIDDCIDKKMETITKD